MITRSNAIQKGNIIKSIPFKYRKLKKTKNNNFEMLPVVDKHESMI